MNIKEIKGKYWLIWSIEHNAWWRENEQGYCFNTFEAGKYTFKKAYTICNRANFYLSGSENLKEIMVPSQELLDIIFNVE